MNLKQHVDSELERHHYADFVVACYLTCSKKSKFPKCQTIPIKIQHCAVIAKYCISLLLSIYIKTHKSFIFISFASASWDINVESDLNTLMNCV